MGKENPVVVLVIVLVLAAYGLWLMKNPAPPVVNDTNTNTPTSPNNINNANNINVSVPVIITNYEQASTLYKNYRIQLDEGCKATPSNISYKNGTDIMIDNRAPVFRTVRVGSVFTLEPYGFKVIKLFSPILPATWHVDCDEFQNVATILIQN